MTFDLQTSLERGSLLRGDLLRQFWSYTPHNCPGVEWGAVCICWRPFSPFLMDSWAPFNTVISVPCAHTAAVIPETEVPLLPAVWLLCLVWANSAFPCLLTTRVMWRHWPGLDSTSGCSQTWSIRCEVLAGVCNQSKSWHRSGWQSPPRPPKLWATQSRTQMSQL